MSDLFEMKPDGARGASTGSRPRWFVRVAVERGMDKGAGGTGAGLTYSSEVPLEVGRRVEVPLGRGDKLASGIVVAAGGEELLDGFAASKVKPIAKDAGTGLLPVLVDLARWMSGYYVCPLGMVLSAMMPAAVKRGIGRTTRTLVERVEEKAEGEIREGQRLTKSLGTTWEGVLKLERAGFPLDAAELAARLGDPTVRNVNRLIALGLLRRVEVEDVRAVGGVPLQARIEQELGSVRREGGSEELRLTGEQSEAVQGIAGTLGSFAVHLLRGVTGSGKTEVYLRLIERVLARGQTALMLVPEISLTPQTAGRFQERFHAAGVAVLHSGLSASQRHREWMRAGSGRAQVVVGARSAVFAPLARLGVIVVDEEHASDYKQDQLPRYHGRDVAIKRGQIEGCPVLLGTATPSLESWANAIGWVGEATERRPPSDQATKGGGNGRKEHGSQSRPEAPGGSARGKYRLWELTRRVGGGELPRVQVVDMREERRLRTARAAREGFRDDRQHLLGPTLEGEMERTLRDDGQVLLFLNKRGYASYIACRDQACGFVLRCDDCDAFMVEHRVSARADAEERNGAGDAGAFELDGGHDGGHSRHGPATSSRRVLRCHHCLAQRVVPRECPVCRQKLMLLNTGTQRAEEEVDAKFGSLVASSTGGAWLARVDGDTMATGRDYFDVLDRFSRGEIRVLLGTQVIAKGLDFPNVRLVGVINADTALNLPDFRASERTFQLVSQVAGRAGRGRAAGLVVVQTLEAGSPAIRFASTHDFVGFATQELASRRRSGLPPVTKMARVVVRDLEFDRALGWGKEIAAAMREEAARMDGAAPNQAGGGGVKIMGPMSCPVSRVASFHRVGIELIAPRRGVVQEILGRLRARGMLKSDSRTAVDVDPISLM